MYADVIVLTYQPPDIGFYTYQIPQNLKSKIQTGQLVNVPFGKRNPIGVVIATSNRKPATKNLKPVSEIVLPDPLILPYQIDLLKWMAIYYHAPMVNCLEAMLPPLPARLSGYQAIELSGKKRGEGAFERVDHSKNLRSRTFGGPKGHLSASEKVPEQKRLGVNQTIVLVPTINRLPKALAEFPSAKNYTLYHNQLALAEKFANWQKIKTGQVEFVFGLRSAIFCPYPNLARIIIFDEHDTSFKDERSPYFDALTIAEKLQDLTRAKIQIIDAAPKITTYFAHKNELKISSNYPKKVKVKIVSMAAERNANNYSPISQVLISSLVKALKKNGTGLLFLNKKSESGQIYCKNCKYQTFTPKKPLVCPNCKLPELSFYSLNIATLANVLRQFIPKAKLNLIAEGTTFPQSDYQSPRIDIATSYIFYAQVLKKYDVVSHILIDTVANIPDFVTDEKVFGQISKLAHLVKNGGIFLIQTNSPQNQLIEDAAKNNFRSYFERAIAERKMLSYPPFALVAKLTIKGKNREKISSLAHQLATKLKQTATDIGVFGPYQPIFTSKVPRYNIILKKPVGSYDLLEKERASSTISQYLGKLPRDWQITIEPDSLN